ncbi:MAG: hypothetical protein RSB04_11425 [Gordonibacter sp.]|uniref:hypothetical protein n=1 Tax=Gordonibacter sp. TaxID=1968902 RepID=UPI002FCC0E29
MSLTIIEDTRQQLGEHEQKNEWWGAEGVSVIRCKLAWGDYILPPPVSVDTKRNIAELAQNIDQQHDRFRAECLGARDAGCQLVILVENEHGVRSLSDLAGWMESSKDFAKRKGAKRRYEGLRLAKACATMSRKYSVRFEFCAPEEAAARVVDILTEGGSRDG